VAINGWNLLSQGLAIQPDEIRAGCTPGADLPPAGSLAWKLQSSTGNGMPGSATACVPSLMLPPGVNILGSAGAAAPVRAGGFRPELKPELATNWGIGFDYAPTGNLLSGLDLQATYYSVKLNGVLRNFGQPNSTSFNDPQNGLIAGLVPTDWLNSGLPG